VDSLLVVVHVHRDGLGPGSTRTGDSCTNAADLEEQLFFPHRRQIQARAAPLRGRVLGRVEIDSGRRARLGFPSEGSP